MTKDEVRNDVQRGAGGDETASAGVGVEEERSAAQAATERRMAELDDEMESLRSSGRRGSVAFKRLSLEKGRLTLKKSGPGSKVKRERREGEAAEERFRKFLATGTAYRFLQQATAFMTDKGFKVLRALAEGKPCRCGFRDCPQREPDMRAFKLLADSLRVVADAELAMAQRQPAAEDERKVVIEWPSEGQKG